jgi:hypothetical protein
VFSGSLQVTNSGTAASDRVTVIASITQITGQVASPIGDGSNTSYRYTGNYEILMGSSPILFSGPSGGSVEYLGGVTILNVQASDGVSQLGFAVNMWAMGDLMPAGFASGVPPAAWANPVNPAQNPFGITIPTLNISQGYVVDTSANGGVINNAKLLGDSDPVHVP